MTSLTYDSAIETTMNAFGAILNSGTLKIYSGTQPAVDGSLTGTLLVTLTFGSTAFGSSTASGSGGTMNANSITSGTAVATNTAAYFALVTSGSATVGTGSVGTSGADLNLSTTSIVSGANVAISAFSVTMPQTAT